MQAVFIDRDGTIGGGHVVYPGDFQLYPRVQETMNLLKKAVGHIFSFTNQPGIARGKARKEDFEEELLGFGFTKAYLCPHDHHDGCECRKPAIGMLLQAAREYDLNLESCVVIGDRWTDMLAAERAGCMKILVKTGVGSEAFKKYRNREYIDEWGKVTPDYIAENFSEAVQWLLERKRLLEK